MAKPVSKRNNVSLSYEVALKNSDKALLSLEKANKHAKKLVKHKKRAIAAILDLEAALEDVKFSKCKKSNPKKKKSAKKSRKKAIRNSAKKNKTLKNNESQELAAVQASEIFMATAADIEKPLLSITSLENTLTEPKNGQPDELHLISGVGPKLEELLHGLGVYHFEQIANWTKAEIDWMDDYLQFSGRIERDNWVEQAKALAKGGRDEYVRVFGKEPR